MPQLQLFCSTALVPGFTTPEMWNFFWDAGQSRDNDWASWSGALPRTTIEPRDLVHYLGLDESMSVCHDKLQKSRARQSHEYFVWASLGPHQRKKAIREWRLMARSLLVMKDPICARRMLNGYARSTRIQKKKSQININ